jgi:beta-glucosidase
MVNYDIRGAKYTYMYYDKAPLYPFGYGMSYTSYDYSNLRISKTALKASEQLTVSADITNSGKMAGTEIVQLYTHARSSVTRPVKELKGFARVTLQPGETKTVTMTLSHDALAYYNAATSTFDVEQGIVDIYVAASSADVRLSGEISTEAATVKTTYQSAPTAIAPALAAIKPQTEKVYNLNGSQVGTTAHISALPRGLYIAKGRLHLKKQ